ncbi:tRNA dimethylallyltransferase, mitochondrial [Coemansia sp. RSA 1822]|nr:tRNA dimethylallyltransferase, mitochondrial [Coemansia sp. RSA 638]KAJ2122386.1 tRNA dimethylallyltransferase, mitochondrial [Coemansia sp. RSA 720]KAJ2559812.1 tRNA dimethylallyltransferase, mitochondrial [Coemansia sp. RSA 1822]
MSLVRKGLIAIVGTTGVGKSQLAIEIARSVNGEIINADALQVYKGYDIITNKVTPSEMHDIPHHLLGTVRVHHEYTVQEFERDALQKITEIHSRNHVPILVGGTHYYVQSVMFGKSLVRQPRLDPDLRKFERQNEHKSNIELWHELRDKDPVMAENWHANNRRKVLRSLEVLHTTGRKHSEWVRETEMARKNEDVLRFPSLLLWLHADTKELNERLDSRVDSMVGRGMFDELEQLGREMHEQGVDTLCREDFSTGVKQAIGFREFQPYFHACHTNAPDVDAHKAAGIVDMKTSTRRYAKRQISWLRNKLVPECQTTLDKTRHARVFVLDATDLTQWNSSVRDAGLRLTRMFLAGDELPDPASLSPAATALLADVKTPNSVLAWKRHLCSVCSTKDVQVWLNGDDEFQQHQRSRRHRRNVQWQRKNAREEQADNNGSVKATQEDHTDNNDSVKSEQGETSI